MNSGEVARHVVRIYDTLNLRHALHNRYLSRDIDRDNDKDKERKQEKKGWRRLSHRPPRLARAMDIFSCHSRRDCVIIVDISLVI